MALGAALLSGCADPGDTGTTYAEAAAMARTCQSLLERRASGPVEPIDPAIFQAAMDDPRLRDQATAQVLVRVCNAIGRRQSGADST